MRILIILLFISFNSFSQSQFAIDGVPKDAVYGIENEFKVSEIKGDFLVINLTTPDIGEGNVKAVRIMDGVNHIKRKNKNILRYSDNEKILWFIDETQVMNFFAQFGWEYFNESKKTSKLMGVISSNWILKRKSEQL